MKVCNLKIFFFLDSKAKMSTKQLLSRRLHFFEITRCWSSSTKLLGMMFLTTSYMIVELVVGNLTNR